MKDKTIVWAVDIYESDKDFLKSTLPNMLELSEKLGAKIQPVYILSPKTLNVSLSYLANIDIGHYKSAAQEKLTAWNEQLAGDPILPANLVTVELDSLKHCAVALSDYAKEEDAIMIVSDTHNPNALERFFIGSFTEALLAYSEVPVYCTHAGKEKRAEVKTIVLPTLFDDKGKPFFDKCVSLAKQLDAKIELLNILPSIQAYPTESMILQTSVYDNFSEAVKSERARVEQESQKWVVEAKAMGVEASLTLSDDHRALATVILDHARAKNADLIAISSKMNAFESALLGSTAKGLLRKSELPVFVLHE